MKIEGVEIPMSTRIIADWDFRYVKPPASSLDWMGADWDSPVSLSFVTERIDATRMMTAVELHSPVGPGTDAVTGFRAMRRALRHMAGQLQDTGTVADVGSRVTMILADIGRVQFLVKAWPAIPGVTVPMEDTTI